LASSSSGRSRLKHGDRAMSHYSKIKNRVNGKADGDAAYQLNGSCIRTLLAVLIDQF
jgi:hypothetical protein